MKRVGWIVLEFISAAVIFCVGMYFREVIDHEPKPVVEYVVRPRGEFEDVKMAVSSSMGNTFYYLCDLHIPEPPKSSTAECERTEP